MKKLEVFLGLVIISVFAVGCASAPSSAQGNAGTGGIPVTPVSTAMSFDGYWELPEGDIFLFEKNAFVLFDAEGDIDFNGILYRQTGTQIVLALYNRMAVGYLEFSYKALSDGNIQVSFGDGSGNRAWAHGIWKKRNDLNVETINEVSANPVLGYWERKQEQQITIYHFLRDGVGFEYTTDTNYLLNGAQGGDIKFGNVIFDPKLPLDKFQLKTTIGDNRSSAVMTLPMNCVIDSNDLLIGFGDDSSKYARYTRK